MKILSTILIGLLAMSTVAVAQSTNNEVTPQKPEIKKEVQRGPRGPMMHQGEFGGQQRGPMFRGGRGPQTQVSPNDRPEEWESILKARRDEFKNQLNPSGPYPGPRGPRGPMFRGGQERPVIIVVQCQCQQGQKFQKRHQFRGGR